MLSVYQAELPAHGSRGFFGLFVKSCLWGRRRDVHTVLGWFEPGLQAPLAKAFLGLSGLYATKLRYGGHERGAMSPSICKVPTPPDDGGPVGACLGSRPFGA